MNTRRLHTMLSMALAAVVLFLPIALPAGEASRGMSLVKPNPFTKNTEFELTMPQAGKVSIIVYDVLGQRVRVLVDEKDYPQGIHPIKWDGDDEAGVEVIPGVYVCVLYSKGIVVKSVKAIKVRA